MIISCNTMDEFFANIKEGNSLVENTVWTSITKNPTDGDKKSAVVFDVTFQASAIIIFGDNGEALLEFGIDCGKDYHDQTQDYVGSEEAEVLKDQLNQFCNGRGILPRPGIVSM